ncbi:MAG TPA: sterol desaturase family protein [Panacibacter sp.]|nr:sterol desaturase family protein [Panacibacter sp.]HNP44589.1 sterol desaturase family protein [Panacibacter sp.]
MNELIRYFETIPSLHRALILAGGITLFWMIESGIPMFRFKYNKWKHAGINIFFTITTIIINFAFAYLIVLASDYCISNKFGLLQWVAMPLWLEIIAGLLLLDLVGAYSIHYLEHKVKWLWKFHMIHHSDTHVDTTTANRHHPGESVFRAVFTIMAVFITGAPIWLVMMYQTLSAVTSQFNHANIQMPEWLDKLLRFVLVTPNMHRVHHHFVRPQTDSNYSNIFSVWDRVFGTYMLSPIKDLRFGLDVLEGRNDENIGELLKTPFDKTIKTDY